MSSDKPVAGDKQVSGDHPIDPAELIGAGTASADKDPDEGASSIPGAESGIPIPTPLKKEHEIRAEEARQSARDLVDAAHGGEQPSAPNSSSSASAGTPRSADEHDDGNPSAGVGR